MTEEILKRLNELLDETDFPLAKTSFLSNIKLSKLRAIRQNKNLPSIEIIIELSKFCNCSASYILGLSKFPDEFEKGLDIANIRSNLRRFIELHPPRFFYLKCRGFFKQFPAFKKWLNGSVCPNTYIFVELAKTLDLLAEDLLRK